MWSQSISFQLRTSMERFRWLIVHHKSSLGWMDCPKCHNIWLICWSDAISKKGNLKQIIRKCPFDKTNESLFLNYLLSLSLIIKQNSNIFVGRIAEMKAKREKRLTRMVIIMVLAFNASWTPYAIVCTLKLFNKNFISPSWTIPGLLLAKRWATFW